MKGGDLRGCKLRDTGVAPELRVGLRLRDLESQPQAQP